MPASTPTEPITEPRQYRGLDGYVGFRQGRIYQLRFTRLGDGRVRIEAGHTPGQLPLLVPESRFEAWWVSGRE